MEENNAINTLKKVHDFYLKTLEDEDAKGHSEIYKECFENLITYLSNGIEVYKKGEKQFEHFNIINEEYQDGYFIFALGTNSVVEFDIEELPDRHFGLWFVDVDKDFITADVFWQYKKNIDKFKPSASTYCYRISFYVCDKKFVSQHDFEYALLFTLNEPELAFCREYLGWNYNEGYHSRLSAKCEFYRYKLKDKIESKQEESYKRKMFKWVKNKLGKLLGYKIYIYDQGPMWAPRYQLYASIENKPKNASSESSSVWLEDIDKKIYKKFKAREKHYNKMYFGFSKLFHEQITFIEDEKIEKVFKGDF